MNTEDRRGPALSRWTLALWLVALGGATGLSLVLRSGGEVRGGTVASTPSPTDATRLDLTFTDERGRSVIPSKAEMLTTSRGHTSRVELSVDGGRVGVPLDHRWLEEQGRGHRNRHRSSYLLLEAPGFVTICSESFSLLGVGDAGASPVTRCEVRFPQGASWSVDSGRTETGTLVFRRPHPRFLRLVDQEGLAVAGVQVSSYLYWSSENHCAYLSGVEPLGRAISDDLGRVEIADGDFEYAFVFEKRYWLLESTGAPFPDRLVTRLDEEETEIRLRELPRHPLRLTFLENGTPAAGRTLVANLAGGRCGATWGNLATSDEHGRVHLDEFCAEEYDRFWINDTEDKRIWTSDPRRWNPGESITIDLAVDA